MMHWVFGYCLLCWSLAWLWLGRRSIANDLQQECGHDLDAATVGRAQGLMVVLAPAIAPFAMVFCLWSGLVELAKVWQCRRALRVHTDPELTPVNVLHLRDSVQRWFDQQTPEFFQHGFRMLDDVRWRTLPIQMDVRFFHTDEGEMLGSIFSSEDDEWLLLGMSSVLQDGTVIETTSMSRDCLDVVPGAKDGYIVAFAPENTVDSVLDTHLAAIEESGQLVHCFAPIQFREVKVYTKRVWSWWKHRSGEIKDAPPEPVLPVSLELTDPVLRELVEA